MTTHDSWPSARPSRRRDRVAAPTTRRRAGPAEHAASARHPRPTTVQPKEDHTVTSELRQLRRVRWAVRLTLALGISASLAANVLHARHLLIDQIISGWPPIAVFATIEAIARVPIRRRWLAAIRMTGLGFVAGIAFWVS